MKIIYFTPSKSKMCGIWTYTQYLFDSMADKSINIEVIMNFDKFQKRVKEYKPDLVHLQDEYGIVPESLLYYLNEKNIHYVVTMHTIHKKMRDHHDAFIDDNCKQIILHSEDQKKALLRTHPNLVEKIVIIPHGSFPVEEDDKKAPVKGKRIRIGAFGFSSFPKRFIETFEMLKKTDLDFEYCILSSFSQDNIDAITYALKLSDLKNKEDDLASKENRRTRLQLNNQFLDEDVIVDKLKKCDILVSMVVPIIAPSVSGSSRFLLRAGRPVIVSDIYHYSDVPDDVFVKIHPTLPPKDFEWAVNNILEDYIGYIERAKKFTEETSWENTSIKHINLYNKILGL